MVNIQGSRRDSHSTPLHAVMPKNPFLGKLLEGNTVAECKIRSLYCSMKEAARDIAEAKPSAVVFANSSGFPLFRIFNALKDESLVQVPTLLLPLSSHHFHPSVDKEIKSGFKEIRKHTIRVAGVEIAKAVAVSPNPQGPVYFVDEVLSGACMLALHRGISSRLSHLKIVNDFLMAPIASQRMLLIDEGRFHGALMALIESGLAYANLSQGAGTSSTLALQGYHLTPQGLARMVTDGVVAFKNNRLTIFVKEGAVKPYPVIDLFTTDNQQYNPLLFLNRADGVLVATPRSYANAEKNVSQLVAFMHTLEQLHAFP